VYDIFVPSENAGGCAGELFEVVRQNDDLRFGGRDRALKAARNELGIKQAMDLHFLKDGKAVLMGSLSD
jgi:hypothetical protein